MAAADSNRNTAAACARRWGCIRDAAHAALLQYPGIDCGGAEWNCVMVNGFYWQCRDDDGVGASAGAPADLVCPHQLLPRSAAASLGSKLRPKHSSVARQCTEALRRLLS